MPDCNYWQYALQLNLYRHMLETEYGLQVVGMYLGIVHPESLGPRLVSVPRLDAELDALVEFEVEAGRAKEFESLELQVINSA